MTLRGENRMKCAFITLGCKVNQYETQGMISDLQQKGYELCGRDEQPDVIVINSCTVTSASDSKVRQTLRRQRKEHPHSIIVLTGCMTQAFPQKAGEWSEADIIIGNAQRKKLAGYLEQFLQRHSPIVKITPHGSTFEQQEIRDFADKTRAFVKIEDGCNRFCSYCIIPYARGRVRSRSLDDIRGELLRLSRQGYREVVFVGINLSAFGQDTGHTLMDALKAAEETPGIVRVRLGSLEPDLMPDELIEEMRSLQKLCHQFHLSLQSGCDETLKRMNRHYDCAQYAHVVERLRAAFPDAAVTTDIMVGFAGETRDEFETSLAFARQIAFAKAHIFPYSRREGTRAAGFPDQVPPEEKARRAREMAAATDETREAFFRRQAGTCQEVLIETRRQDGRCFGHTRNYTPVLVTGEGLEQNDCVPVRIEGWETQACTGRKI